MKVKIFPENSTFFRFSIANQETYNIIKNGFSYELPPFLKKKFGYSHSNLIKHNSLFYVGLFTRFIEFLEYNNIEYEIQGKIIKKSKIEDKTLDKFINALNLSYSLYPHQYSAIKSVIENKRQVVLSPTSSGKSLIIAVLMSYFLATNKDPEKKCVLIVPNKLLVNQMMFDIKDYFSRSNFPIDKFIQLIHSEIKDRDLSKPIIITTWQSSKGTASAFEEIFKSDLPTKIHTLLYDEVHYSQAPQSRLVIESACNAEYKVGLTGTLFDDDQYKNDVIQGLFGETCQFIRTRELIDMGFASELDIYTMEINFRDQSLPNEMTYQEEVNFLRESHNYLRFVSGLVSKNCLGGNTLILHRGVQYGMQAKAFFERYNPGVKTYLMNGGVPAKEREAIRQGLVHEKGSVLFATFDTMGTGVSIKNLHSAVFLEGIKSNIKTIQSVGRLLRVNEGKDRAVLFDFVPVFTGRQGFLEKHGMIRQHHYRQEEHNLRKKKIFLDF